MTVGDSNQLGVDMNQENANNTQTTYTRFEDLPALPADIDRTALLETIRAKFESKNWKDNMEAIDAIRTINKFYPVDMNMVCSAYWKYIVEGINNVRSAVSKCTLLFTSELFQQSKGFKLQDSIILDLVPVLMLKSHNDKGFLKVEAQRAIDLLVVNCVYDSTIVAFCRECFSKHGSIAELSTKVIAKLIGFIGTELPKLQPVTFKELFITLAKVRSHDLDHGGQAPDNGQQRERHHQIPVQRSRL